MKKAVFFLGILFAGLHVHGQSQTAAITADTAFQQAITKWFDAWTLISTEVFKINKVRPVDFVFFDEQYVYTTVSHKGQNWAPVKGPQLMNLNLQWFKALHHDSLLLPDNSVRPVELMSFAAPGKRKEGKPFFVMPLHSFWQRAGVSSKELGLQHMITGVFLHEFSHSQQMKNFGRQISTWEQETNFGTEFNDDIVQNLYKTDTVYVQSFRKEVAMLFAATQDNHLNKDSLQQALHLLQQRHRLYFKNTHAQLSNIDEFFLSMEGIGQYAMYAWLVHPSGAGIERKVAIAGVRRGGRWWSQDEGLALFLILEKLSPPHVWAQGMFGEQTENVLALIDRLR